MSFRYDKFVYNPEEIPPQIIDLLQVAAYIFCADRMASRGARDSVSNGSWARTFIMEIPVVEVDFWNSTAVKKALSDALVFMTGDRRYEFVFKKARISAIPEENIQLSIFNEEESEVADAYDADVMLFSGGLDSLMGAIEQLNINQGRKLCLISHRSSSSSIGVQKRIIGELKKAFGDRILKYGFECHNKKLKTVEETQRTRMFLFSAIAFSICERLKKTELYIYENGVTSINLPIQVDTINGRASRTTHPKTIGLLQKFYNLFNPEFKIITPYRNNTKAEIVEKFRTYNAKDFIAKSVSCSSSRNKPIGHCGVCSQCIDRKFAMYASDLEDEDDYYDTNFVIDDNSAELRNRLLNSLLFINKIKDSTPFELWKESPKDFYEIASYWNSDPDDSIKEIYDLLSRYADSMWEATRAMVAKHFSPRNVIRPNSLMRIIINQEYLTTDKAGGIPVMVNRDEVFISYSHADKQYIDELQPFLKVLSRDHNITYWYDGKIASGADPTETIRKHLRKARIALLLVSQNFLASDFIHNEELPELIDAAIHEGASLFWLPLNHCSWDDTFLSKFQSVAKTNPMKPLSELSNSEKAAIYKCLYDEIKAVFQLITK